MKKCKYCQAEKHETEFAKHRAKCKTCRSIDMKEYHSRPKIRLRNEKRRKELTKEGFWKEHYKKNKTKRLKYYYDNKEKISIRNKKYKKTRAFKDKINIYYRNKRKNDINYRIKCNLSRRINDSIQKDNIRKCSKTTELLGCSIEKFKIHIESQFKEGMSWENYGYYGWHIDHIKPCAAFDLSDEKQQKECFHYSNMQPLWAKDNLSKSSKQ